MPRRRVDRCPLFNKPASLGFRQELILRERSRRIGLRSRSWTDASNFARASPRSGKYVAEVHKGLTHPAFALGRRETADSVTRCVELVDVDASEALESRNTGKRRLAADLSNSGFCVGSGRTGNI